MCALCVLGGAKRGVRLWVWVWMNDSIALPFFGNVDFFVSSVRLVVRALRWGRFSTRSLHAVAFCVYLHLAIPSMQPTPLSYPPRSFFSKSPDDKVDSTTSPSPSPGEQFVYEEDWGEKYNGVSAK